MSFKKKESFIFWTKNAIETQEPKSVGGVKWAKLK